MFNITFDFSGNNYVVTGASSGMGRKVAEELAAAGATVLAIARRQAELDALQAEYPENIRVASVDVCDYAAMERAIAAFVAENGKLDGAVHAAGITGLTPLKAFDQATAEKIMEISFWAGVNLVQVCSKVKNSNKNASFVLFSSVCSHKPDKGLFAYAAAKASVTIAVKSFAKEICKRGLRINAISPGWVQTSMTSGLEETHNLDEVHENSVLGTGKPEDVTGTVLFLLSDRARWITGTDVVVDGGYLS